MASQVPAGALVDRIADKAAVVLFSILAFGVSALLFAVKPVPLAVYVAEMLHSFSSCTLAPAIAALSLMVAAPAMQGPRFGRNARFAAIGNGIGAALMGAFGYYVSERERVLFDVGAGLADAPGAAVAEPAGPPEPAARPSRRGRAPAGHGGARPGADRPGAPDLRRLRHAVQPRQRGDAAAHRQQPDPDDRRRGEPRHCRFVVLPQLVVALISPAFGRLAEKQGRRLVLLLGICTLPIRGGLFAVANDPALIVLVQILDGVAGASLGVLVPLVTSDVAGRSRHFNLALGFVGLAIGIGSTVSTGLAGSVADRWGQPAAFAGLAAAGLAAAGLAWGAMPETKSRAQPSGAATQ